MLISKSVSVICSKFYNENTHAPSYFVNVAPFFFFPKSILNSKINSPFGKPNVVTSSPLSIPLSFSPLKPHLQASIQGSSWWWSSFFHGLFPSGWRLLSPLLLCLPLHLNGRKPPLKDLIETQRSSLHRSSTSKLPSSGNQSIRDSSRCSLNLH